MSGAKTAASPAGGGRNPIHALGEAASRLAASLMPSPFAVSGLRPVAFGSQAASAPREHGLLFSSRWIP